MSVAQQSSSASSVINQLVVQPESNLDGEDGLMKKRNGI